MNYLVTGCSRGVGLEICRVLLEQGHTVYGVARSYTDEFKKLESEFDNKLFFKSIDLGDSENVHRNVFKDFVNNRIQLHGYVNNAAMAYDDIVTNLKLDRLQSMYSVNVFAVIDMLQIASRLMARNGGGCFVNIASITGVVGSPGQVAYSSTKGAVIALTKSAAKELSPMNIRVNAVAPGIIATERFKELYECDGDKIDGRISRIALGRLGTPLDVADAVSFLASDRASYISGHILGVDGCASI